MAGWRQDRSGPRPFVVEIERGRRARSATVFGTAKRFPPKRDFALGQIGAAMPPGELRAAFDRFRPSGVLHIADVEQTFVQLVRAAAAREPTVGPHVLCILIPRDGPTVGCFHAATPHMARLVSDTRSIDTDVAHTPWVLSSQAFQSPQMTVGQSVSELDGISFIFEGPAGPKGLSGLASSLKRPGP